ncbi:MAG TPA: DUF3788 domain-containing protein [Terracidiphilus sp.]|jgi:hypothetical protein
METVNAFIGKTKAPTEAEVAAALGSTAALWKQLVGWMAEQGAGESEWNSSGVKYGWALRLKVKKRNIVYLGPCAGCFRVAFVLGDKAVAAARKSDLAKSTLKIIDEAPRYAEGTGVRLIVKAEKDLGAIKKLALIKMAN